MKNVDEIKIFDDNNYIEVTISPNVPIDNYQMSAINSGNFNLVTCTRDRYKHNTLLYYVENYLTFEEFLATKTVDSAKLRKFLLQIIDAIIQLNNKKLISSNLMLDIKHIFFDEYTNDLKLIYIPLKGENNLYQTVQSFKVFIEEIINKTQQEKNEFLNFVLKRTDATNFDFSKFRNEINSYKIKDSTTSNLDKYGVGFPNVLITIISLVVFSILLPLLAVLLHVPIIIKHIDFYSIIIYAIMFSAGLIASIIIYLIMSSSMKNSYKNVSHNDIPSVQVVPKKIKEPYSAEINITNLPSDKEKHKDDKKIKNHINNTESFGKKEYIPKTSEIKNNGEMMDLETAVLLDTSTSVHPAYIVSKSDRNRSNKIDIDVTEFIIGRFEENCNYYINDSSVSKQHAIIRILDNEYYICDNNSSNGTFLNGIKLKPNNNYKLSNEDIIKFSNQEYVFFEE